MSERKLWTEAVHGVKYDMMPSKPGKPECLVAVYTTDRGTIREYIGIEGTGFARVRAEMWWAAHVDGCWCPDATQEAMATVRCALAGVSYRMRQPIKLLVEQLPTQQYPSVACWRFE